VVCDWINAGSKEVASFVTMLTGSFKAYARIIAEQLAFGIAAQAVFEAPPLPAIRMSQQIKTCPSGSRRVTVPGCSSRMTASLRRSRTFRAPLFVTESCVFNGVTIGSLISS
jgi:hypothetical protein